MFTDHEDYDSDEEFTGGSESSKKEVGKKTTTTSKTSKPTVDANAADESEDEQADDLKDESQEHGIDYPGTVGIKSEYTATYTKVIEIRNPSENMTIDKLSKFDHANLISIETKRIESEDYPFIDPGSLDAADQIAEATIARRKCPYNVLKCVGYRYDHANMRIIEIYEDFNPNEMMHPKLNVSKLQ